jgi:hypothetical protein
MLLETICTLQQTSELNPVTLLADKDKCNCEAKEGSYQNIVITLRKK